MGSNGWEKDGLLDGQKRKVAEIEAMQQRLAQGRAQGRAQLLIAIDSIENRPEGMPCDDNTQRVLERLREEGAGVAKAKAPRAADRARSLPPTGR